MKKKVLIALLLLQTTSLFGMEIGTEEKIQNFGQISKNNIDGVLLTELAEKEIDRCKETIKKLFSKDLLCLLEKSQKNKITKQEMSYLKKGINEFEMEITFHENFGFGFFENVNKVDREINNHDMLLVFEYYQNDNFDKKFKFKCVFNENMIGVLLDNKDSVKTLSQQYTSNFSVLESPCEIRKKLFNASFEDILTRLEDFVKGLILKTEESKCEYFDETLSLVTEWYIPLLATFLSKEEDPKKICGVIKKIQNWGSLIFIEQVLSPFPSELNESNIVKELKKMSPNIIYGKKILLNPKSSFCSNESY